jgi:hypothetical protein
MDNGIVAGVYDAEELIRGYREIGFCENMCSAYDYVRDYLNVHKDALRTTSEISPNTPCDALTTASDFEAREATADATDVELEREPILPECPKPRHSGAPPQGCVCAAVGCSLPDAG